VAHVIRRDRTRTVKKLTEWEPRLSRPVGKARLRWLNQVEEDLRKMKVRNWREKYKDRRLWNEIIKQAKNPPRVVAPVEKEEECLLAEIRIVKIPF
jgi:hypothetical protein